MTILDSTGAAKIFENSEGTALIMMVYIQVSPPPQQQSVLK